MTSSGNRVIRAGSADDNYCPGYKTGDIVVMIANFEDKQLRFQINGKDYGKIWDINPDFSYRAAVSLWDKGDAIQLIS